MLLPRLFADTVTLNDGTTYSGKIVTETADSVVLQVQISAAIQDEKTILKTEIKNLEKDGPDIQAYNALPNKKPDALNSFTVAVYERSIEAQKTFLQQYPSSKFATEIRSNIEALEQEKSRIQAGSIKINGYWMSQEEAVARKPLVSGLSQLSLMRSMAASGDLVGALNTFDTLEKTSALTAAYPEAVDLATKVVAALEQEVEARLRGLVKIKVDMKTTIEMASSTRRVELQAAMQRETAGFEAAMANSERLNLKWPPLFVRHEPSLTKLKALIPSEKTRLAALPLANMRLAQQSASEAQKLIEAKDLDAAQRAIADAEKAWPQCESAAFFKLKLQAARDLARQEEAAKQAAAATPTPTPTPTPQPTPAKPKPTPIAVVAPPEEEPSFFMTLPGIAVIAGALVAIAGGITLLGRIKKSKTPEENPNI